MNGYIFLISFLISSLLLIAWKLRSKIFIYISLKTRKKKSNYTYPAAISENDSVVLLRSKELLSSKTLWAKNNEGHCVLGEKITLYCALALAAKEINGTFSFNSSYSQIIIFNISRKYKIRLNLKNDGNYWDKNLIFQFNNHPQTNHEEVIGIISDSILFLKSNNELNIKT